MKLQFSIAALGLMVATGALAATVPAITIEGKGVFPESLSATKAGDIYVSSTGTGAIYRAKAGASKAELFIDPAVSGLKGALGVFADEGAQTLYVCGHVFGAPSPENNALQALRTFDLATGKAKATYPMPNQGKALCNDIAVGKDGAAYVAETMGGQVLRLKPGAQTLEVWIADPALASVDGLAFGSDNQLYVNTYNTHKMLRVAVKADGSAGAVTELKTSEALGNPDGLRHISGMRFLQVEGKTGRVAEVEIKGDEAIVKPLKTDAPGWAAVVYARGHAWGTDMKSSLRREPEKAEPFVIVPVAALKN